MKTDRSNIIENRRRNLVALVDEQGGVGEIDKIAAQVPCNPEYIRQLIRAQGRTDSKGPRGMGPVLAAKLEAAFGKPAGWMDRADAPPEEEWRMVLAGVSDAYGPRVARMAVGLQSGEIPVARFDAALSLLLPDVIDHDQNP